jgi:hypothetical protein
MRTSSLRRLPYVAAAWGLLYGTAARGQAVPAEAQSEPAASGAVRAKSTGGGGRWAQVGIEITNTGDSPLLVKPSDFRIDRSQVHPVLSTGAGAVAVDLPPTSVRRVEA